MALLLRRCKTLVSPRLSRLSSSISSSSSSDGGGENDKNPPPPPPPSHSSYLSNLKANLRQSPPSTPRKPPASRSSVRPSILSPKLSKIPSLDEIGKNLSESRRRPAASSQSTAQSSSTPPPVSFRDIYNSKLIGKPAEDPAAAIDTKKTSFYSIRESLRQLNRSSNPPSPKNRSKGSETLEPLFSESLQKFQKWLESETDSRDSSVELRKSSEDSSNKSSTFMEGSSSNGPKKEEATEISPEN